MPIEVYKKTSAGRRFSSVNRRDEVTAGAAVEKSLLRPLKKTGGRNFSG
ncbi:MAG: 50S ribosomal protein L2, partial [Phycisphaerae bacterium]|nr:50S ribosomal protein L2 [Phycisphaerae bacterium]